MAKNINSFMKEATRVDYVGHMGHAYKEDVKARTLSGIMDEIGGFARKSDGKWQYPPRIVETHVSGHIVHYKYISALYEFEIIIHLS